jgi:hypothetical protein
MVFYCGIGLKEKWQAKVMCQLQSFKQITKKDQYPLPFCEILFEKVVGHEMYTFKNGYKGYHQVKIVIGDHLKIAFITPWGTFCYIIMPFGLCNV